MRAVFFLLVGIWWSNALFGQTFETVQYTISEGLTTEMIKAINQDSEGFIWIGTDEGLIKYDGLQFSFYLKELPSPYVKDLYKTSEGRLFVLTDLGLNEIISKPHSTEIKKVLDGKIGPESGTLWYPKKIFEDRSGNLWISEPNSITKYDYNTSKRYFFKEDPASDNFSHSYVFFEDQNGLPWIMSYYGRLYRYNSAGDRFDLVKQYKKLQSTSCVLEEAPNTFLFGTQRGVFRMSIRNKEPELSLIDPTYNISSIKKYGNQYVVGTFDESIYFLNPLNGIKRQLDSPYIVEDIFVSNDLNIWASTNDGVYFFNRNFFNAFKRTDQYSRYVESLTIKNTDTIYYVFKEGLDRLTFHNGLWQNENVFLQDDAYFFSLAHYKNELWVSDKFSLYHFIDEELVNKVSFPDSLGFIFNVNTDDSGNVWASPDIAAGLLKIDNKYNHTYYGPGSGLNRRINVVKSFKGGEIFCAGSSADGYLFRFDPEADKFINLSLPAASEINDALDIQDFDIDNKGRFWLGSKSGLFLQDSSGLHKVALNKQINDLPVRAVKIDKKQYLWFSVTKGLIKMNLKTGETNIFDETVGLPSNTISKRGIDEDQLGRIWVATTKGVAKRSTGFSEELDTKPPFFQSIKVGGADVDPNLKKVDVPNGSSIEARFISLSFPGTQIEYQYRVLGKNEDWQTASPNVPLTIYQLNRGDYNLEVRARKKGGYKWSEPTSFHFHVKGAWFFRWWAFIAFVMLSVTIAFITYRINHWRSNKRRQQLIDLVEQRTEELLIANRELKKSNKQLDMIVHSASHDLKAPLNSIEGLIDIFRMEKSDEVKNEIVTMIQTNVKKLESFITDIIDFSKASRLDIQPEEIDLKSFFEKILEAHRHMPKAKSIQFNIDIDERHIFKSDPNRLRMIFNNLISNAIKYHDFDKPELLVNIEGVVDQNSATIYVIDNGKGIEAQHQDKIFDMFYRIENKIEGSGLGLYIMRETLYMLNGQVELTSEIGEGTTFKVTIPNATN